MRPDQRTKLETLTETLTDVVLDECEPETWPGAGKKVGEMTQQERGDRFWCKRNAAATLGLLERVQRTLADVADAEKGGHDRPDLDKEIAKAERDAARLLSKVQQSASAAGRGR